MELSQPNALKRATKAFETAYGREPTLLVRAPGRVNLIGEHTDYNDGFVFPMALPFAVVIAAEPRFDRQVEVTSEGFAAVQFSVADEIGADAGWSTYVHGTAKVLEELGHPVAGWTGTIASDIPNGASLSSSAALEVAAGLMFVTAAGGSIDMTELAKVGQQVENEVLGLPTGIMDQLASATSYAGMASLIDCRDLSITRAVLPAGVDVVIMDTGTRRELVDSAYAERRRDCEAAAAAIGVDSLRDASLDQLELIADPQVRRRAQHVITENARTLEAAAAMNSSDPVTLGRLMNQSHSSLRSDYQVSGPALDRIVALAQGTPGCLGARMTGGGFAGCAVALVESAEVEMFIDHMLHTFKAPAEQPSTEPVRMYAVSPAPGASVISDSSA